MSRRIWEAIEDKAREVRIAKIEREREMEREGKI